MDREAVELARRGSDRDQIVVALARETDALQRQYRDRLARYERAAERHVRSFQAQGITTLPLGEAHRRAVELATTLLPFANVSPATDGNDD